MKFHTTLALPDIHSPWHDQPLLNRICQLASHVKVDSLALLGDTLDLYSMSKHNENSLFHLKDLDLQTEYEQGAKVIRQLESAFPKASKAYLFGNHESRFDRWIEDRDNAKVGRSLGRPEEALRLRENGWRVLTNHKEDSIRVGKYLDLVHGDDCPKHAAAKYLETYEGSVVFGHTHRFQSFVTGKRGAWNIGWLGNKDARGFRYLPKVKRAKWVQAFALVYTLTDGGFLLQPVQCWKSRFVFNGRLY